MRTLDEIRQEMRDAASYYEYAKQAEVQSAMDRHEAVYGALAWVLEEPWKSTGEFDKSEDRKLLESFLERLKKATQPNNRIEESKRLLEELQFDMTKALEEKP